MCYVGEEQECFWLQEHVHIWWARSANAVLRPNKVGKSWILLISENKDNACVWYDSDACMSAFSRLTRGKYSKKVSFLWQTWVYKTHYVVNGLSLLCFLHLCRRSGMLCFILLELHSDPGSCSADWTGADPVFLLSGSQYCFKNNQKFGGEASLYSPSSFSVANVLLSLS